MKITANGPDSIEYFNSVKRNVLEDFDGVKLGDVELAFFYESDFYLKKIYDPTETVNVIRKKLNSILSGDIYRNENSKFYRPIKGGQPLRQSSDSGTKGGEVQGADKKRKPTDHVLEIVDE